MKNDEKESIAQKCYNESATNNKTRESMPYGIIIPKGHRLDHLIQTTEENRKLSKWTIVATVLILLLIPLALFIGETYLVGRKYYFIAPQVMFECMILFFLIFEGRKLQAREVVIIAVLCAISLAGRATFFMLPQFKSVMALTIIAGVALGGETGFLVGAVTMLTSHI